MFKSTTDIIEMLETLTQRVPVQFI